MRKFASELEAVGVGLPGQPGDQDQCHSSNFEQFLLCFIMEGACSGLQSKVTEANV